MSQTLAPMNRRVGYAVKRVQQVFRQAADEALRPYGLSMPQYAVLAALAESRGASGAELARQCFVTRQTMTGLVSGLLAIGLVAPAPDPGPGRALPWVLSRSGRARVAAARDAVDLVEHRMTGALERADRERLLELLEACALALAGTAPDAG